MWQGWWVWPWPRPSWTTLYTCAAIKGVQLLLFSNRSILLCFLPVHFKKLLWLRPSWTILYTEHLASSWWGSVELYCTPLYNCSIPGASLASAVSTATSPTFRCPPLLVLINCSSLPTWNLVCTWKKARRRPAPAQEKSQSRKIQKFLTLTKKNLWKNQVLNSTFGFLSHWRTKISKRKILLRNWHSWVWPKVIFANK